MGWIGTVLITAGNIWLAKQHINAFILIILGNLCWLVEGLIVGRLDMIALALVSTAIHSRNYAHWKKNDFKIQNKSRQWPAHKGREENIDPC